MSLSRRTTRIVRQLLLYMLTVLFYYTAPVDITEHLPAEFDTVLTLQVFMVIVMFATLAYVIMWHLRDQQRKISEMALTVFITAHACAFTSYTLAMQEPDQFSGIETRIDALYFTVTTMATVGFGDVHPSGQEAKTLIMAMIVFDLFFLAALFQVLVSALGSRSQGTSSIEEK